MYTVTTLLSYSVIKLLSYTCKTAEARSLVNTASRTKSQTPLTQRCI